MSELVECRSDGDYAGRPVRIHWQGKYRIVKEVLANWRTPEGKHYRVITRDEKAFECWYSESDDQWIVEEI
jgi:hypothetical protein